MKKAVLKIRKSAKVAVITVPVELLEASGLEPGDIVVMGATHGRLAITPVDTSGIADVLGVDEDFEEEDPLGINPTPPPALIQAKNKANGKAKSKNN